MAPKDAVYRTELDNFARIIQLDGEINESTTWFKLEAKNGRVSYFGSSTDTRHKAGGRTETLSWALKKEEDRATKQNNIQYFYTLYGAGEYLLTSVKYTGDTTGPGNRSVEFGYVDNNDYSMAFLAGGKREKTKKLSTITTKYASNTVRTYTLNYGAASAATGRNLLRGVTECVAEGEGSVCLPQTVFEWHEASTVLAESKMQLDGENVPWNDIINITADFNGDGFKDKTIKVGNNTGNGIIISPSPANNQQQSFISFTDLTGNQLIGGFDKMSADVDNNGIADWLGQIDGKIVFYSWQHSTGSFVRTITDVTSNIDFGSPNFNGHGFTLIDINGDGKKDIVARQKINAPDNTQALYWYKNTSANNAIAFDSTRKHLVNLDNLILFVSEPSYPEKNSFQDLDGNGYPDILLSDVHKVRKIFLTFPGANGDVSLQPVTYADLGLYANPDDVFGQFVDLNGDGLSDYVYLPADGKWRVQFNQGDGSYAVAINTESAAGVYSCVDYTVFGGAPCSPKYANYLKWGDIDDDGYVELLVPGGADRIVDEFCYWETGANPGDDPVSHGCGDELYPRYRNNDRSVYYADVIDFNIASDGISLTQTQRDIRLSFNSQIQDLNADGLTDVTSVFHGRIMANGFVVGGDDWKQQVKTNHAPDLMKKVTNGLAAEYKWHYAPLSSGGDLYKPDPWYFANLDGKSFHFTSSMNVVDRVEYSSGNGSLSSQDYAYRVAVYNAEGRGFQGFKTIIVDNPNGIRSVSDFHQVFPLAGKLEKVSTCLVADQSETCASPISTSTVSYLDKTTATSNVHWVLPTNSVKTTYDLSDRSKVLSTTTTVVDTDELDNYGSVGKITATVNNGFSTVESVTVNNYTNDTTAWWFKLDNSTVTTKTTSGSALREADLDPTKAIKTSYTYVEGSRLPDVVTVEPTKGGGVSTVVDKDYNSYGLPKSVSTYEKGQPSKKRTEWLTYTDDNKTASEAGYFAYQQTNSKGHVTTMHTYQEHGQVKQVTDANELTVKTSYDAFGRVIQTTPATGQPVYVRYQACDGGCDGITDTNIRYKVSSYSAGTPISVDYKDKLNRVILSKTEAFEASGWTYVNRTYDSLGRLTFESIPSSSSSETKGTSYSQFDALGRLEKKAVDQPDGNQMNVTYSYSGHETSITAKDSDGNASISMSRTYSGNGQLMQTTDALEGKTKYAYDAMGNPIVLQDAKGQSVKAKYNALGQKLTINDPNMGAKTFAYTPFGEIYSETDANSDTFYFVYDELGRITLRYLNTAPTDSNASNAQASFEYDAVCKGTISKETRLDLSSGESFAKSYGYDDWCRPDTVTTNIDGTSHQFTTQYDGNYARVKAVTYPTGITVANEYNARGYLTKRKNAESDYVYHEVTAMDNRGAVTGAKKANGVLTEGFEYWDETGQMKKVYTNSTVGTNQRHHIQYTYDGFGNLASQTVQYWHNNALASSTESYQYDDLHRLTESKLTGSVTSTINYGYDAVGNLTKKDDYASTYTYGKAERTDGNAGPNAIYSITKAGGGTVSYQYDNNGNRTHENNVETIQYNAFNKPVRIVKNGIASHFTYGADQKRYKQVKTGKAKGTETTIYVDKAYKEISYDGKTKQKLYIGDAIITKTQANNGSVHKAAFVHRDRLGSVVTITDVNGNVIDNKSYDPFGKPRKVSMQSVDPANVATLSNTAYLEGFISANDAFHLETRRGFTDHEHLDDAELIHMNGRVYDYNLGRFLSVDPFIQDPGNSQSMNPYSYIMNNPLAGTDPSGYRGCAASRIKKVCETYGRTKGQIAQGGSTGGSSTEGASNNGSNPSNGTANQNPGINVPEAIEGTVVAYVPGEGNTENVYSLFNSGTISNINPGGTDDEGNKYYTIILSFKDTPQEAVDKLAALGAVFYQPDNMPNIDGMNDLNLAVANAAREALGSLNPVSPGNTFYQRLFLVAAKRGLQRAIPAVGQGHTKPPQRLSAEEVKAQLRVKTEMSLQPRATAAFQVYKYSYKDGNGENRQLYWTTSSCRARAGAAARIPGCWPTPPCPTPP